MAKKVFFINVAVAVRRSASSEYQVLVFDMYICVLPFIGIVEYAVLKHPICSPDSTRFVKGVPDWASPATDTSMAPNTSSEIPRRHMKPKVKAR
jgi:hypothetical protein